MAVSEEEVIKRKLLIEGDGNNDDRRIGSLMKTFIKWCKASNEEEDNIAYQRMLGTICQCEFAMQKSYNVYNMNEKQQETYKELSKEIDEKIEGAVEKISDCKNELLQAKRVRKNRQEYDALAKVIQQHPDRQDTMKQIEALDKELAEMQESKESLEQKLDLRRKQFHVLITAIHEMQRILEDDDQKEEKEPEEKEDMDTS